LTSDQERGQLMQVIDQQKNVIEENSLCGAKDKEAK
jgi:hypothetical protein